MALRFIAIEGGDFAGKTTQTKLLARHLRKKGYNIVVFREPGGTQVGEQIRKILLNRKMKMALETELLLYMASRAQLVRQKLLPALRKGKIVICDRYLFSSVAYQGYAGGLGIKKVLKIANLVIGNTMPDLTIILDIDPAVARERKIKERDRIEKRPLRYHIKVREGFLKIAKMTPQKVKVIDASGSIQEVFSRIVKVVEDAI